MRMKKRSDKLANVPAEEKSIYQLKQALQSQHRDHSQSDSEAMLLKADEAQFPPKEIFRFQSVHFTYQATENQNFV